MKVKELLEKLEKIDPETEVVVMDMVEIIDSMISNEFDETHKGHHFNVDARDIGLIGNKIHFGIAFYSKNLEDSIKEKIKFLSEQDGIQKNN